MFRGAWRQGLGGGGLLCAVVACGAPVVGGDAASTGASEDAGDDGSTEGSSTAPTSAADTHGADGTDSDGGTRGDGGSTGISTSTGGGADSSTGETTAGPIVACDPFAQDCPEGEKCMPYVSGGNGFDAHGCFALDPRPVAVGQPCQALDGGGAGLDNCEGGAMCWNTNALGAGTCVALCLGSAQAPVCAEDGAVCQQIDQAGALHVCLLGCSLLQQDCPPGEGCYFTGAGPLCAPDLSGAGGGPGDACVGANSCDPGLICIGAAATGDSCVTEFCCSPFCDLSENTECPAEGQVCQPVYERGTAPPGEDNLGLCMLPPP